MTESVLVAVDGSEQAERALDHALGLFPDASVTLLSVVEGRPRTQLEREGGGPEEVRANRRRMLSRLAEGRQDDRAFEIEVTSGRAAGEIVAYADDHDVDHVVVGSHGREGVSRVLLGSVAETVVRRAPVPVTVVR